MSKPPSGKDYTPVWETREVTLLALARSILESEDIPFFVQGEEALQLLPLGTFGAGLFSHGVGAIVFVPSDQATEARALLSDLSTEAPSGG